MKAPRSNATPPDLPVGQNQSLEVVPSASKSPHIRLRVNRKFLKRFNPILVVGSPRPNIWLSEKQKLCILSVIPPHRRGVRVVTNVEAGCGGRDRGGRRLARARTVKPCGPGAPKQALSSWEASFSGMTVATKRWSPGRARSTPLKPLRGEGRVFSAEPVVLPRAFCCTRTMGTSRCPVFPAPSLKSERPATAKLGRDRRRESARLCRSSSLTFEEARRRHQPTMRIVKSLCAGATRIAYRQGRVRRQPTPPTAILTPAKVRS